jgi:putative SOS response-associated peptidase YedK
MCNLFESKVSFHDLAEAFGQVRLPLIKPKAHAAPNLEPLAGVRPTDPAPVIRRFEAGVELTRMRWGFVPDKPKAPPVTNFRSEGRRFTAQGRCLIPATGFFEFTGRGYPKTRWRFALTDQPWFCFAGLWRAAETAEGPAERFTLLTTAPGPDLSPYHDRQVVVLGPQDWAAWLNAERSEEEMLRAGPAGTLTVSEGAAKPLPLFEPRS